MRMDKARQVAAVDLRRIEPSQTLLISLKVRAGNEIETFVALLKGTGEHLRETRI